MFKTKRSIGMPVILLRFFCKLSQWHRRDYVVVYRTRSSQRTHVSIFMHGNMDGLLYGTCVGPAYGHWPPTVYSFRFCRFKVVRYFCQCFGRASNGSQACHLLVVPKLSIIICIIYLIYSIIFEIIICVDR